MARDASVDATPLVAPTAPSQPKQQRVYNSATHARAEAGLRRACDYILRTIPSARVAPGVVDKLVRNALAFSVDDQGRADFVTLSKDPTAEDLSDEVSYHGKYAGQGARTEREYRAWAMGVGVEAELARLEASDDERGIARLLGAFLDIWIIVLEHDWGWTIIVICVVARYLLQLRPRMLYIISGQVRAPRCLTF